MTFADETLREDTARVGHAGREPAAEAPPAGDPAVIGVPLFVIASVALGLLLVGYVPAASGAAVLPLVIFGAGMGCLVAAGWAARLAQNAVAAVFGIFAAFWLSYALFVLGLTHGWFGIAAADATRSTGLFLISWLITIVVLTVATLRLPAVFTLLFTLVDIALLLILLGTLNGSTSLTTIAGYVVFAFALVGIYLFGNAMSMATGGKGLPLGRPLRG